jgi:hypothetical protein
VGRHEKQMKGNEPCMLLREVFYVGLVAMGLGELRRQCQEFPFLGM